MAELNGNQSTSAGRGRGKPRTKTMSTKIDFTPMVDLGFLLISFFMLTTTLSKPTVMAVALPDNSGESAPVKASKTLTLLLGANDKVYWYDGLAENEPDSTDFNGLRKLLLDKIARVNAQHPLLEFTDLKSGAKKSGTALTVLIKPGQNSRYENFVDAIDEMAICKIRQYAVVKPDAWESDFLK